MRMSAGRWALAAVAVPVAAKALRRVGRSIQARRANAQMNDVFGRAASGLDAYSGRSQSYPAYPGR